MRSRFVVPCAGKLFRSSISRNDKALCFVLNKGYFESDSLKSLLSIVRSCDVFPNIVLVGGIEKIKLTKGSIVYRQRIFFRDLGELIGFCKASELRFELSADFHITINNVMNCLDDLVYLERYASRFDESIDAWLTHCLTIELWCLLTTFDVPTSVGKYANRYLRNRKNYLFRAPFLSSGYSIDTGTSGIFMGYIDGEDDRICDTGYVGTDGLVFGYTNKNILRDIKEGVFK